VWEIVNTGICAVALLCSLRIVTQLIPLRPWHRDKPRLRCLLVLIIAVVDLCFSLITLSASIAILADVPSDTTVCTAIAPLFDVIVFLTYLSVANLAHYSLLRLQRRQSLQPEWLGAWYLLGSIAASLVLSTAVPSVWRWRARATHSRMACARVL